MKISVAIISTVLLCSCTSSNQTLTQESGAISSAFDNVRKDLQKSGSAPSVKKRDPVVLENGRDAITAECIDLTKCQHHSQQSSPLNLKSVGRKVLSVLN